MKSLIKLQEKFHKSPPLFKYLFYSILVTILDIIVVWVLYRLLDVNLVISNSTGVISGFIVHYILSSKSVFHLEYGIIGFVIYLGTFIFGLFIANSLIYVSEVYFFNRLQVDINFMLSKGVSIVVPFLLLYYLRRFLYSAVRKSKYGEQAYGK